MLGRPTVQPPIGSGDALTREQLLAHIEQWRADTHGTVETLAALRQQVDAGTRHLENPKAAVEYLDFFAGFFTKLAEDLDALLHQVSDGPTLETADLMRQLANNAAVEQRRTVQFRDKWVNKPLPYETMRPMLTQMASDVRDQLADYKDLIAAARRVTELVPPPPPPPEPKPESFDRRALFRRIVRPLGDDAPGEGGGKS